ncbi:MAG: hypothetical protein HYX34_10475 [Actinobacteria bacterium]|nr:hypothetical protein [Actinomycetota bacterium]
MRRGVSVLAMVLVLVLVAVATVGCGRSGDGDKRAEPTTTASPVSTTTTDPWAVPDQIDVAYVQRVVDGLSRILTKAWQLARDRGKVDAEVERLVRSVDEQPVLGVDLDGLQASVNAQFADVVERPRPLAAEVRQVQVVNDTCVVARMQIDFSKIVPSGAVRDVTQELVRRGRNDTGWTIAAQYFSAPPARRGEPCQRP